MQVFIVDSPYRTASFLDSKRLNKQIVECRQILDAIEGRKKGWANHPVTKMYRNHVAWLALYMQCLQAFKDENFIRARQYSNEADNLRPAFHCNLYYNNMRSRLYTKDPIWYSYNSFMTHGKSEINMYWNTESQSWMYYRNGKKLKLNAHPKRLINRLIASLNGGPEDWEDAQKIAEQLKATGDPYLIDRVDWLLSEI